MRMLHTGLEQAAAHDPDRTALTFGTSSLSFSELEREARAAADRLAAREVGAGDRVAVMLGNRPELVAAVHAISKLGAAAVLLNPGWKAFEVAHALEVTAPAHAVCDATTADVLGTVLGSSQLTDVDAPAGGPPATADQPGAAPAPADPGADALLVFSSGTTGRPKAARHTHASITRAVDQWRACLGLGPEDRFQIATPPSHILGLLNLLTAIDARARIRLHRRFDLDEVLGCIAAERMTLEMAVAPIALAMAQHPDLESYDLSSLRYIMWGATPVTTSVAETVTRRSGVRWLPAYGATEFPVITANPVAAPESWRLDSVGLPAPDVELRVVDLDTGAPLEPGATGEVQVRGPSAMAGYLPAADDAAAFADGWYRTGDVGWVEPEGWVHLTDRSKEMIKVSGFQVAPAELEAVLLGHPAVADCAVFGVPDPRRGEVPVAAVALAPGATASPEELSATVAESLASYKRLHQVVVVEHIPRLPSGKVLRRQLRDSWAPDQPAGTGGR